MREIKFRAWDKERSEMYEVDALHFHRQLIEVDSETDHQTTSIEPYELMQYTGLKDKNGTEIYDGDIIRGLHDFGPGGFSVIAAPVKYHVIHGYQLHYFLLEQTEVIGNIYENPELLERGSDG